MENMNNAFMNDNYAEMMQSLLDELPFGILFLDRDLSITGVNAFLRDRLPEVSFQSQSWPVENILNKLNERPIQAFRQVLENGHPVTLSSKFHRSVFCLKPLPGSAFDEEVPQSVTVLPVLRKGAIEGLAVVVRDVSDRLLAENELKREIEKLTFLHELDLALNTLELDECIRILVTRIRHLFNADFAGLLVIQDGTLQLSSSDGLSLEGKSITLDLSSGLTGWAMKHQKSIHISDVQIEPRYVPLFDSIRSEMVAPLVIFGQCIGVIDVESCSVAAFSKNDLTLLETVAFSAANALHNARIHSDVSYWRTHYQAIIDQADDIIYTVDRNLCLTGVNAAWNQFARENGSDALHSDRIIGENLLANFANEERDKWEEICRELLNGTRPNYQEDITCHAPEKERWLTLKAAPLINDHKQISGITFSTHDVSEHINYERHLHLLNQQLETMLSMSHILSLNLLNNNIPNIIVKTLAELLQADCVVITQFDKGEKAFKVLAAHGASERHINEFLSPQLQANSIITEFGTTGAVYNISETLDSINRSIYIEDGLHGLLYSLIYHQGEIIGSLNLFIRSLDRRFTQTEMDLMRALTPQISLAVINARMYDQLRSLATTDGLTELANRRQLDDLLANEVERGRRYQRVFSILMIDLDNFKCFNDTFGHDLGDDLLKKMANLFKSQLRAGDIAARYGGDEFVVILPETDTAGAQCIAHRLRESGASIDVPRTDKQNCKRLTLSIGISSFPSHAGTAAQMMRCADQALYRAKEMGRNRVEIFSET